MRRLYRQIRDALEARLPTTREMRWRASWWPSFAALDASVHGLLSGYTEDGGSAGEVALMSDILVTVVGSYHHAED